jgi:hypothetical protein
MSTSLETELKVGPKAIDAYSRLSYTMWFALAEFVDNSTQSRINAGSKIGDQLKAEGQPLTVEIIHDRVRKEILIQDNSIGMSKDDLIAALQIATPTVNSKGRSKYGMGMKTAACWIGRVWTVTTCQLGSGEEWTATVDVDAIVNDNAKVRLELKTEGIRSEDHYTKIKISSLRRVVQKRSEETIMAYLGSMYMFDLRPDKDGEIALKLTYNGVEVNPPQEMEWDTAPDGVLMKRDLPELNIKGKTLNGWIGVVRKGGRKIAGFSLYQNTRQIQGYPNAWKPKAIFGGVDDEGANNLVAQRLTGVLLLDGFIVSHTKDAVLFEEEEEDAVEKFLIEETKAYAEYAKNRRGASQGARWSKDKLREFIESMRSEFVSDEFKDALNNASLPPLEVIAASNQSQLRALTAEDEISRFNIMPDLQVIISFKEISEWEPHVTFVPGAEPGVLHVIINGLHPYYQTLESTDAIDECVHQYIFDAVAEFKTGKLISRVNPDSVRRLKNDLLRARATQLQNADETVRDQARSDLFGQNPEQTSEKR